MIIFNGKSFAEKINAESKKTIEKFKDVRKPCLVTIAVNSDEASKIYLNAKQKKCNEVGIEVKNYVFDKTATESELIELIEGLNNDKNIDAILVQLPLPKNLNERNIINAISPQKDVDCLTDINLGKLLTKTNTFSPCTAEAVCEILNEAGINPEGKNCVILGRKILSGRSIEIMLNNKNATTTLCHTKTQNIEEITKNADMIISCIGKAKFLKPNMVKKGAVVIDVGISRADGKIYGDADFDLYEKCDLITPVPNGVGPVTVAMVIKNTIKLWKNNFQTKIIEF